FKAGHPLIGESLENAVKAPAAREERGLEEDAQVLKEMPQARVEIVGFTDSHECLGRGCCELSLRRAKVVYEWFLAHGVPAENLESHRGRGSEMAIGDNNSASGRQQNRRTEVHMIPTRDTPDNR